jgi:hypothetical protein
MVEKSGAQVKSKAKDFTIRKTQKRALKANLRPFS